MSHATEEPRYRIVDTIGEIEIRHYEPSIQAVTTLAHNGQTGRGFKRLAGFIFGDNSTGESIAMTAPVQESLAGPEPEMAFTMPSAYEMDDLPEPRDGEVWLEEVPERTMAVISFSGWATASRIRKMQARLEATLVDQAFQIRGDWLLNQYNPPWTPPFLRRNEIWIELEPLDSAVEDWGRPDARVPDRQQTLAEEPSPVLSSG